MLVGCDVFLVVFQRLYAVFTYCFYCRDIFLLIYFLPFFFCLLQFLSF